MDRASSAPFERVGNRQRFALHPGLRWSGFSGQGPSLTLEAGNRPPEACQ